MHYVLDNYFHSQTDLSDLEWNLFSIENWLSIEP